MSQSKPRVVIVGAGFGGLSAAKELSHAAVDITIIDQQNHHLFQPLLYQVATAALTPAEIAVPIRNVLRKQQNATILMDRVTGVDPISQQVSTEGGRAVPYDTLILATGARHSYFGNDHWAAHAPGLKTLQDAFGLREKILSSFEQAEILADTDPESAATYQRFVVIGAGPTGVELAGAIAELASSVMRDFRRIKPENNSIILLEGGDRALPSFDSKLSDRAARDLLDLGVELRVSTMVTDVKEGVVETDQGKILAQTVVWAAGVQASPAAEWLQLETARSGHVVVDDTLRPEGFENIYVIGDTAHREEDGTILPGIAPVAKQMGRFVGQRILKLVQGEKSDARFSYSDAGALATIGRNRAVADIFGLKVTGFIGWVLWGAAHVYFLIGFKNRLFVILHWVWSYLTWQRGVRLIMHGDNGTPNEVSSEETPQRATL